ncbi:hypothetical protein [Microlunatus sp. Gsoil 973]|uniref:hypothetical protein n=1 Tax=Microlunatus sp. Gsoil 973 TaxID=2672569 RepID=UPI0012B4A530|nr:hypothetical protein [Microlunatus sp. Gsoil 973]QGN32013.1 hypothetical protein GJV80_03495 [Microlunatus sp. Gsoil 973]
MTGSCGTTGGDAVAKWWTALSIETKAAEFERVLAGPNRDALLKIIQAKRGTPPVQRSIDELDDRELVELERSLEVALSEVRAKRSGRGTTAV